MKCKTANGFPGYYITDTGVLYSRKYGRIKKMFLPKNHNGYLLARIQKEGKRYTFGVHRLVAEAFIPNPENKPQVNHINGIRTDNSVKNLEWVTCSENMEHSYAVLGRKNPMLGRKGKDSPYSKKIVQKKDNKIITEYYGCYEAERETGIFATNIFQCLKQKRKTAGGFQWQYAN